MLSFSFANSYSKMQSLPGLLGLCLLQLGKEPRYETHLLPRLRKKESPSQTWPPRLTLTLLFGLSASSSKLAWSWTMWTPFVAKTKRIKSLLFLLASFLFFEKQKLASTRKYWCFQSTLLWLELIQLLQVVRFFIFIFFQMEKEKISIWKYRFLIVDFSSCQEKWEERENERRERERRE